MERERIVFPGFHLFIKRPALVRSEGSCQVGPGAMAAEIIWPHNAFNYVAVPSETVGEGALKTKTDQRLYEKE